MNRCWDHKKLMAPGCEPKICKQIIDAIKPISYGMFLDFLRDVLSLIGRLSEY